MNADAWKKSLLRHLPYGVIGLAAAKLSEAWRLSAGTDFSAKFLHLRDGVAMAFRNGLSGFVPLDLLIGFLCGCALCLLVHATRWFVLLFLFCVGTCNTLECQEVSARRRIRRCPLGKAKRHCAVHGR